MQVKETLPRLREDNHGIIPADPKLSLFQVEQEKLDLIAFRDECESDEERAAVDQQIQEYVGKEIRKVTGIAALLKHFKAQAAMAKAEEERAAKWRKRWESNYERLKNMVHGVMLALDLPKVEGATDRFRRQKNPVALEITDPTQIPEQYLKTTIRMPYTEWKKLVAAASARGSAQCYEVKVEFLAVTTDVDTAALKAELQATDECIICHGLPLAAPSLTQLPPPERICERCGGTNQIPRTVPGARLVQGEHLRVE